jgi:hypothetical protein
VVVGEASRLILLPFDAYSPSGDRVITLSHLLRRATAPLAAITLVLVSLGATHAAPPRRIVLSNVQVSRDQYLAHSEPAIAENPRDPNNLIAGSKMFTDPTHYAFKIGTYYSKDGGRTWHDNGFLPGFDSYALVSDVSIAFGPGGTAYICVLAWDGKDTSGIFVSRSQDGGKTWSLPRTVYLDKTGAVFSDKPWIVVDTTNGPYRGLVYVTWNMDGSNADLGGSDPDRPSLRPRASSTDSGWAVAVSTDYGKTFSLPHIVAPFTSQHFYIGAVPAVAPNGNLAIVSASYAAGGDINAMALVTSQDGGATFSPVRLAEKGVVPLPGHLPHSTFRNTSMPSFAISPKDGSMVMVWADYRHRDADVMAAISRDGGKTWSPAIRVNHDRIGNHKDQFEPQVAVAPDGTFTCAWFDRRWDPNDTLIDEAIAQSSTDGRTWGKAVRVTQRSWNPAIGAPEPEGKPTNTFIGDYQALAVDNRAAHPLWNDTQNGASQQIRTARVTTQLLAR